MSDNYQLLHQNIVLIDEISISEKPFAKFGGKTLEFKNKINIYIKKAILNDLPLGQKKSLRNPNLIPSKIRTT